MREEGFAQSRPGTILHRLNLRLPTGGGHTRVFRHSSPRKEIPLLTTTGVIAALWSFVHGETHLLFVAISQVELHDWLIVVELVSDTVSDLSDILRLTVGLPLGGR